MKNLILLAACLMSFACAKSQVVTSGHLRVHMADSITNDSTTCTVSYHYYFDTISIDSSFTGEVVHVVDSSTGTLMYSVVNTAGASPWVIVPPVGWAHSLSDDRSGLTSGPAYVHWTSPVFKIATTLDTVFIFNKDSLYISNPCQYDTATGHVFIDNNSNCVFDPGDVGINQPPVSSFENLSSPVGSISKIADLSSTAGYYLFYIQKSWMVNYTVSLPSYYAFIFPFSSCYTGPVIYTTLPMGNIDFPLQCTHLIDVQCYALSPGSVRLHRSFYMQPYVSNTGCDTAAGTMTLVKDSRVTYNPALSTNPADTVRGDTLIWNYAHLTSLSLGTPYWNSFMSNISLTPDITVVAGDTLCFHIYTNIPTADINPANNDYKICLPVVYSYDPNVKEVSPAGSGPQGYIPAGPDTLTYALHFQNTGSAAAIDVKVIDTLDSHINPNTLQILGASHNMTPQWLTPNVVEFDFANINLPDSSSNEPASHGEVRFNVALKTGLAPGTQIKNKGYIYFDANPAVVTNTTLNTIAVTTNVSQVKPVKAVTVYPNPATDYIVAEHLNGGQLSILNMDGVVVLSQDITNDKTTIDLTRLSGGVYILRTVNNVSTSTTRFTKY